MKVSEKKKAARERERVREKVIDDSIHEKRNQHRRIMERQSYSTRENSESKRETDRAAEPEFCKQAKEISE